MSVLIRLLRAATVMVALGSLGSHAAITEEAGERPSITQIRHIELAVRMPDGAASLADYIRYYYRYTESGRDKIVGMYVEKHYFEPDEVPADGIVVVDSELDVPAPWDAGCSVVTVTYDPNDTTSLNARCDSELFPEGDRSKERATLGLFLGALFLWFAWPSRAPRTRLRRVPPWNVAIICAYWMWYSVEAVLTQSTGCAWFGDFSWSCWDFTIADTYIWLGLAGALFISALTALFGCRIGRIGLLISIAALVCWLLADSMWIVRIYPYSEQAPLEVLKAWLTHFGPVRLLVLFAELGVSVWAVMRKNASVFFARSA